MAVGSVQGGEFGVGVGIVLYFTPVRARQEKMLAPARFVDGLFPVLEFPPPGLVRPEVLGDEDLRLEHVQHTGAEGLPGEMVREGLFMW